MESPGTVLIVDDEASVRRLLRRCFEGEGYTVLEAADGDAALVALAGETVDLMTLDLNLAGEDGLHVARRVRAVSTVAIIMISGKGDLIDKVVGLEVGADDYVAKPFELREVLARARSVLRRTRAQRTDGAPTATVDAAPNTDEAAPRVTASPSADTTPDDVDGAEGTFRFAGCELDPLAREFLGRDGEPVDLTTAEFELLHLFVRRGRRALTRDEIMDELKGTDWHPNDRTIDNHVARLRRKLELAGAARAIKTIRGVGYQLAANVSRGACAS